MEYMLGRLNNDADMSSGCRDADVLVRLQGLGRQSLPSGAMQLGGGWMCAWQAAEFCRV